MQGISWTAINLEGESNHAGTTPMKLRKDAGFVAMKIGAYVRDLVTKMGGNQVGDCGNGRFWP
ncbi:MAG: hypothetical protein KTR26_11115 [Flammeovirgaceae bacterium]|nr:hypothetical protein [Flammeovirgaceae bacterium]